MNAEVLNVGTELLVGAVLNTHQQYLGQACASLGINLYRMTTLGDNPSRLARNLADALERSDCVIITGGLGPTTDDVTVQTVASVLGCKLQLHKPTWMRIKKRLKTRHLPTTPEQARQALVPAGSHIFPNQHGTAPGIWIRSQRMAQEKSILLLPGPPGELIPMFEAYVKAFLARKTQKEKRAFIIRRLIFPSLVEAHVASRVKDFLMAKPPVTVGIYARPGEVELAIMSQAKSEREALAKAGRIESKILRRFSNTLVLQDGETLSSFLGKLLLKQKKTLGMAESCTGGLLASLITETSGASRYFQGSVTAYQNELKTRLVGVPSGLIRRYGAVSAPVARQMAQGAAKQTGSNVGLSITGIAGPTGGTRKKPVGLVFIGISDPKGAQVYRYQFIGDRISIQKKAARTALTLLVRKLLDLYPIRT